MKRSRKTPVSELPWVKRSGRVQADGRTVKSVAAVVRGLLIAEISRESPS